MATAEIRLTRKDLLDAALLHQLAAMGSRRTLIIVGGFAIVAFCAAVWLTSPSEFAWQFGLVGGAALVVYLYLILLAVRYVRLPLAVRRQWREQKNVHEPYAVTWSDQTYAVRGSTTRSDLPWSHFLKWRENDRVLLLYQASTLFMVVPKRSMSPQAIEEIRDHLIRARVPRAPLLFG